VAQVVMGDGEGGAVTAAAVPASAALPAVGASNIPAARAVDEARLGAGGASVPDATAFLVGLSTRLAPEDLAEELVTKAGVAPGDAQRMLEAGVDSLELRLNAGNEEWFERLGLGPDAATKIRAWAQTGSRPVESAIDGVVR